MARKEKDFNYFESFNRMITNSCEAADLLADILASFDSSTIQERMNEMHKLEHAGDEENHILMDKLTREFVTPIEREDIITIAQMLDNITDAIDSVCQRLYMFNITSIPSSIFAFSEVIRKCCGALRNALGEFENFKKSKDIDALIIKVNDFEEEADLLYIETQREFFTGDYDAKLVFAWSTIVSRMEACCDACEHVANAMRTAIMKNS